MLENEKIWILQNILSNVEEHNSAKLLRESLFKIIDGFAPLITASGAGIYTGSITPTSTVPVSGDKVFLATIPGTYSNFGGVKLPANHFGFIFKSGNSFSIQSVEMPMQDLTDLENRTTALEKSLQENPNYINANYAIGGSTNKVTTGGVLHIIKVEDITNFLNINRSSVIGDRFRLGYLKNDTVTVGDDFFQLYNDSGNTTLKYTLQKSAIPSEAKLIALYLNSSNITISNVNYTTEKSFEADGKIEKSNTNATSGDTIYNSLKDINAYNEDVVIATRNDFKFSENKYLSSENLEIPSADFGITSFIPVVPNGEYLWEGRLSFNRVCIEYDINKQPLRIVVNENLSSTTITNKRFTVSENGRYVRLCSLLIFNGSNVNCSLTDIKSINKIPSVEIELKYTENVPQSKAILDDLYGRNRLNFNVPLNGLWFPKNLLPANNYTSTIYADLITQWDNLISNYVSREFNLTKTFIGKDQSDVYEMFKVEFAMKPQSRYDKQPTIILVAGIHGSEHANPLMLLEFFDLLLNSNDELFVYLRDTFRFVVVPHANPYGYQSKIRSNSRGVNLNRNFPDGWYYSGEPNDMVGSSGTAPLSEKETQHIYNIIKSNDYLLFIDLHNYSGFADNPNLQFFIDFYNPNLLNSFMNLTNQITRKTKELIPSTASSDIRFAYIEYFNYLTHLKSGTAQRQAYGNNRNSVSLTVETAIRLYSGASGTSELRSLNLSVLVNTIATALNSYSF